MTITTQKKIDRQKKKNRGGGGGPGGVYYCHLNINNFIESQPTVQRCWLQKCLALGHQEWIRLGPPPPRIQWLL